MYSNQSLFLLLVFCMRFITRSVGAEKPAQPYYPSCDSDPVTYYGLEDMVFGPVGNYTVWNACNYPNPRAEIRKPGGKNKCGRFTLDSTGKSWLCDPDYLLSEEKALALEQLLTDTYYSTSCPCPERCSSIYYGHPIVVLLAQYVHLPNTVGAVCLGSICAELYPQLDPWARPPTQGEIDTGVGRLARGVMARWGVGRCMDEIFVVYTPKYKRLLVTAGDVAVEKLGDLYESAQTSALLRLEENPGDYSGAISGLVRAYGEKLARGTNWPLILGVSLSVVGGLVIIFGVVMMVWYCRRERKKGKSYGDIWMTCTNQKTHTSMGVVYTS